MKDKDWYMLPPHRWTREQHRMWDLSRNCRGCDPYAPDHTAEACEDCSIYQEMKELESFI